MTDYIVLVNNPEDVYKPNAYQFHSKKEAMAACKYEQEHGRSCTLTKYMGSYIKKEKVKV